MLCARVGGRDSVASRVRPVLFLATLYSPSVLLLFSLGRSGFELVRVYSYGFCLTTTTTFGWTNDDTFAKFNGLQRFIQ